MKKGKRGFSLTELLLALAIMAAVSLVLVIMLSKFVDFFISDDDQVLARQRGMDVVKMLEVSVLHVGLGIPENISSDTQPDRRDIFERTFTASPSSNNPPFQKWGKSLFISGSKSDDLRLLYTKTSGVFHLEEDGDAFFMPPLETTLKLTAPLDPTNVTGEHTDSSKHTNAWITFPGQSVPMTIKSGLNTRTPLVEARRKSIQTGKFNEKIHAFSEVLCFQARRAWVGSDDIFHFMEVLNSDTIGSGPELTVPGVLRIQFDAIEDGRVLSMDILTRGDTRDVDRIARLERSRPELIGRWGITSDEAQFVLEEISMQWRIRNYETE